MTQNIFINKINIIKIYFMFSIIILTFFLGDISLNSPKKKTNNSFNFIHTYTYCEE